MNQKNVILFLAMLSGTFLLTRCSEKKNTVNGTPMNQDSTAFPSVAFNGYESNIKWGEHLVTTMGCNDCHTPKKMGPQGPVNNDSLALSGHPASQPPPDIDRKLVQTKGWGVTSDETAWVGPWGISYAANLTPDSTGIGNWTEDQFILCLRKGKYMGLESERDLLPPMPWQDFGNLNDNEIKAIFAYLKSIKPIHNLVPAAVPPVMK